jgi:hypothetical protein
MSKEASQIQDPRANDPGTAVSLEELSGILWGLCYLEECIFSLAGNWAASEEDHWAAVAFHTESRCHGLWALSLGRLLPKASGFPEQASNMAALAEAIVGVLEKEPEGPLATNWRVAALFFGWLPTVSGLVETLAEELSPWSSGALVEILKLWLAQRQRSEAFLVPRLADEGLLEPKESLGSQRGSLEELGALGSSLASPLRQALLKLAGCFSDSLARKWASVESLVQGTVESGQDSRGGGES